jgi:hypothetical protein
MLGCGTLVIESAGERGQVTLPDVPHVEQLHLDMSTLLFGSPDGNGGDGIHTDDLVPPEPRRRVRGADEESATLFSSQDDDRR